VIPRAAVGPKPHAGTIPLLFGALVRSTLERAARLDAGIIVVAVDWDDTRERIDWYRAAGGLGPVVVNTLPDMSGSGGPPTETSFVDTARADLELAAAAGADEMHLTLNLGTPVPPDRQVDLLAALADGLSRG
jgi:hypothetical protein